MQLNRETMNETERVTRILKRAIERTREDTLTWEPAVAPAAFLAEAGDGLLRIASEDGDELPPFQFSICNSEGLEVVTLRSTSQVPGTAPADHNALLAELFVTVRGHVIGTDEVLKSIEQDLDL